MSLPCGSTEASTSFSAVVAGCPNGFASSGENVELTAFPTGGEAPYQYVWTRLTPSFNQFAPTSNPIFSFDLNNSSVGDTLSFSVEITDSNGISASSEVCSFVVTEANEECIPECVRWTSVNLGEPIPIYHDGSNWDPNFFTHPNGPNAPDAIVYLQAAVDLWNSAYSCGDLFRITDDRSEARATVEYIDPDDPAFCEFSGTALCVCDMEGDICVRQLDHSSFFTPASPSEVKMYKLPCIQSTRTEVRFMNTYLHELGHVLGMGHVFNEPFQSIMGQANREVTFQLYPWDISELERRYPCDCVLNEPIVSENFMTIDDVMASSDHCPGCRDID